MLHSSTKKLIDRLAEMTELGKLDWTEGDDGNIIYSTEGYSVVLSSAADQIVITSIDGKELERAEASELSVSQNDDGQSYSEVVATMTSEATRIALGTETAISTLLAGMEEPAAVEPEPEPEMAADAPEDAINEASALVEEAPEAVEAEAIEDAPVGAEVEPESEIEAATELDSDSEDAAEEDASEPIAASVTEEPEEVEAASDEADASPDLEAAEASDQTEGEDAPVSMTDASEETELEANEEAESENTVAAFGMSTVGDTDESIEEDAEPETLEATETLAHDLAPAESESELTEAVARLADEVNGRDESGLDAAAASAVGAVALAAGLSQDDEAADTSDETISEVETAPEPEIETQADEESSDTDDSSVIAAAAPISTVAYIPFGSDDDGTPSEEIDTVEGAPELEASEEVAAETTEPEIVTPEPEPETLEAAEPSFVAVDAALEPSEPVAATSFSTFESDPAPEAVALSEPDLERVSAVEPTEVAAEASPEPVTAETAQEPATETTAQSYSLSGIGAGFGLGALAAKTEASGIPGPTTAPAQSEKIIIDATDDVLPEPEGQSTLPPLDSSNGISFGNADPGATAVLAEKEAEADADAESDILKPRTRFNPWD